jgi:hypothetical protein
MNPASQILGDPIASATRTRADQGMPPEEVEAVLVVEEPEVLRRYMELHREQLEERLAAEWRALAGVERSLALAILERTDHAADGRGHIGSPERRKEVHMTDHDVRVTTVQPRTGPVSRINRLIFTAVMAWLAIEWATYGIVGLSQTKTLRNPWFWFLIGTGIYYGVYQTAAGGFGRRWGIRSVVAFAVVVVGAGAAAVAAEGELWAAPLTWLLYGFVVAFLTLTFIAGLASLALGTPGCEFGALGELIRRLRGVPEPAGAGPMWCVLGMHRLDAWEARRSGDRGRRESITRSRPQRRAKQLRWKRPIDSSHAPRTARLRKEGTK